MIWVGSPTVTAVAEPVEAVRTIPVAERVEHAAPAAPALNERDPVGSASTSLGEPDPPRVTVRPHSVQLNGHMSFDQNGRPNRSNANFSMQVAMQFEDGVRATRYRMARFDALTDTGTVITADPDTLREQNVNFNPNANQQQRYYYHVQLDAPPQGTTRLRRVEGDLVVAVAEGPLMHVVIEPLVEAADRDFTIDGVNDAIIRVNPMGEGQVMVSWSQQINERVSHVSFYQPDGDEVRPNGWGNQNQSGMVTRTYRLNLPDRGKVVVSLFPRVREVTIPFTFSDVPLPELFTRDPGEAVSLRPLSDEELARRLAGEALTEQHERHEEDEAVGVEHEPGNAVAEQDPFEAAR